MLAVNETLKSGETSTIHAFERAGLGKAPFRFVGMSESVFCVPGGVPRAGSSCDYCSTSIRYVFWCKSSDGKSFKVGCDCIRKVNDTGLIKQISKAERELRDKKNKEAKARKEERNRKIIEEAMENLKYVSGTLAEQPHPNEFFAKEGKTLFDYVRWCFANRQGVRAAGIIEKYSKKNA